MKRLLLIILILPHFNVCSQANNAIKPYDILTSTILFLGGSWLAYKQLPRLAGEKIEYNSPKFTRIGASILFIIGVGGGIIGVHRLNSFIKQKFD
ncbi:hypothetical protein A3F66_05565 [candidate division TM6 bacterium RIFCSPHIGHO2_12_FULL_32_22]|nr:MAG: hypothetical protein A3F66_05565 [candidate division TM6 bacterium RIFCSPHIGHO2_12_FULL_32_22]